MKQLKDLVRPNIWELAPCNPARGEYSDPAPHVFLDANENPYNPPFNRYPDPLQLEMKTLVSKVKNVPTESVFLGNGSDEAIDLAYRIFCTPDRDNAIAIEPTYGMYKTYANINDVEYRPVALDADYQISSGKLLAACDERTKLIWICTPNTPTANSICREEIEVLLREFQGIVVVDEAYGDFSSQQTFRSELGKHANLIVLNTMSKAWGFAAVRLGMAFASREIIELFDRVRHPYNVGMLARQHAIEALRDPYRVQDWVRMILNERTRLVSAFRELPCVVRVYPTDANFFLVQVSDAQGIRDYLASKGIAVKDCTGVPQCDNCLRITVGTKSENVELLSALRSM